MTYARMLIQDFATANKAYVNAEVTFWKVVSGQKTNVKATVFANISGEGLLANPQMLDSYGKFKSPVYVAEPIIMTVDGLSNAPDHDSGIVTPDAAVLTGAGSPQGVVAAPVSTMYLRTDGGTNTTIYVKETGGNTNLGWVAK